MKLQKTKNEKIRQLEQEKNILHEKLRGFNQMKEQHQELLQQIEESQSQVRKLKSQKKDMSMTYHKELTAQKTYATMMMKQQNEKHLNTEN